MCQYYSFTSKTNATKHFEFSAYVYLIIIIIINSKHGLLLQNCTTFIHLRLFSFYFTFGFTPPPPSLPLLLWVSGLEETSSYPLNTSVKLSLAESWWYSARRWNLNLILHWLNWLLLHFTGHHAIQRKKQICSSLVKSFLLVVTESFQVAFGCSCNCHFNTTRKNTSSFVILMWKS